MAQLSEPGRPFLANVRVRLPHAGFGLYVVLTGLVWTLVFLAVVSFI